VHLNTLISSSVHHGTGDSAVPITGAPLWALGIAIFTLSLSPLGTGTSALANEFVRTQQIAPLKAAKNGNFFDNVADYSLEDWDGDGSKAIAASDVAIARSLLGALNVPEPETVAGADGSVCMEWIRQSPSGEKSVYVDVGPNGKVLTFARFGESSPIEKHFDQFGPDVEDHLRVLFSVYSA
jgi:hypothetical protein